MGGLKRVDPAVPAATGVRERGDAGFGANVEDDSVVRQPEVLRLGDVLLNESEKKQERSRPSEMSTS